ncbi:MAG: hypothetical protein Q4E06_06260 [Lautropia sp.]|nr:hypothetical protein [Lautropia sp.]
MKAKNVVLVLATTGLISSQSLAAEVDVKAPASPQTQAAFTEADASTLFEASGKPMQVAALSSVEMKDTQGAAIPVALYHAAGGIAGLYGAGYGYLAAGGRDPYAFTTAVAGGLASGLFSPVRGFGSAALAMAGGVAGGAISAARE